MKKISELDVAASVTGQELVPIVQGGVNKKVPLSLLTSQGAKGDQGLKGDTGLQGTAGAKGDKGDTGLQGLPGADGSTFSGTTDDIDEGTTNLFFSEERVLSVPLEGLSTALGTAVTSADDVLVAIGKLQAQASAIKIASKWFLILACSDEESPLTIANDETVFRMPFNVNLLEVRASLNRVQGSGDKFTIDIRKNGISILYGLAPLSIDNNQKTSVGASTQVLIIDANLTDNSEISIHITQVGDSTATGLKVTLIGQAV